MLNTKTIVAGIIGGVIYWLLGWVFYGMLLMDFFEANSTIDIMRPEEEMVMWSLLLGNLVWGYFMAYVFHHWANISTWATGAKAGALIGVLVSMAFNMISFGVNNVSTMMAGVVDVVVMGVMSAIIGAVIGWWLGRGK